MLVNLYYTQNQTYVSLNLINLGFSELNTLFKIGGVELKDLSQSNKNIFEETQNKYLFLQCGMFLANVLTFIYENKVKNNLLILEFEDQLCFVETNLSSFEVIEYLMATMYVKDNISVSQKALNMLNDNDE